MQSPWQDDPNASARKQDHIELAFQSQIAAHALDQRFYYEPLLAAHPHEAPPPQVFLGKTFQHPLWISSMTGGTAAARNINHNLARACGEFGFGMGLGSCRSLLYGDELLPDFNVRPLMGNHTALYANLGIAQVEKLLANKELHLVDKLLAKLKADGLIIHVNPLQEWLQPEGDRLQKPPLDTIQQFLDATQIPLIVKEVGQGMGKESLRALLQLPLQAIDFGASGGTNFAKLEMLRKPSHEQDLFAPLAHIGHSAEDMVAMCNELTSTLGERVRCKEIIISGGIKHFLDGYYLMQKLNLPSVYGQASAFLQHARKDYAALQHFVAAQVKGLEIARTYLRIR